VSGVEYVVTPSLAVRLTVHLPLGEEVATLSVRVVPQLPGAVSVVCAKFAARLDGPPVLSFTGPAIGPAIFKVTGSGSEPPLASVTAVPAGTASSGEAVAHAHGRRYRTGCAGRDFHGGRAGQYFYEGSGRHGNRDRGLVAGAGAGSSHGDIVGPGTVVEAAVKVNVELQR